MAKATKPSTTQFLFNVDTTLKKKAKYIAAMDDQLTDQTKVINRALAEFVERWEKKNGPIPVK